jgi:hypothetical protein
MLCKSSISSGRRYENFYPNGQFYLAIFCTKIDTSFVKKTIFDSTIHVTGDVPNKNRLFGGVDCFLACSVNF